MSHRRIIRSLCAFCLILLLAGPALADAGTINPGVKLGQWIYDNVVALFAPILAVVSLYYLAKRQFTKFLSFAAFAVLAALLIFGSSDYKDAAVSLGKWIIGK